MKKNMGPSIAIVLFIVCVANAAGIFSWFLLYNVLEERKRHKIVKTVQGGGFKIADDVDEFSIYYNRIGRQPQPEPKHYKRIDGEFKQVYK